MEIEKGIVHLLPDLIAFGGAVVGAEECSELEKAWATVEGRLYIDADGRKFVRRDKPWLEAVSEERRRALNQWFTSGSGLIVQERMRQIEKEGWTQSHDDQWTHHELAHAAAAYAIGSTVNSDRLGCARDYAWPSTWDGTWLKLTPDDRIRELAKAGALLAAEIDRLERLNAAKPSPNQGGVGVQA